MSRSRMRRICSAWMLMSVACPLRAAAGLVDHDLRVGQRPALAPGARRQQERAHRRRQADADGRYLALDVLHRIVDRKAGRHGAAGAVNIEEDVLVRVVPLEEEHLRDDEVGRVVIDLAAEEDDAVLQQARIDIVRPLAAVGLFHDHRDQVHGVTILPAAAQGRAALRRRSRQLSCAAGASACAASGSALGAVSTALSTISATTFSAALRSRR